MKHFILTAAIFFSMFFNLGAQVYVSSGHPQMDVVVKRAFVMGDEACIDLIITVHNSWTSVVFLSGSGPNYSPIIFDDEGNLYEGQYEHAHRGIGFNYDGQTFGYQGWLKVTRDVPRKMRIMVRNIDEYASEFTSITLPYQGDANSNNDAKLVIKHLPLTRN